MPKYTLTLLDTAGIQDYVFGSNVLRENIGASELVWRTTRLWPMETLCLQKFGWRTNVRPDVLLDRSAADLDDALCIKEDALDAEVVYTGGGNCAILFAEETAAKIFVTELGKRVITQAPGLNLIAVHIPIDWDADALADMVKIALGKLALKKQQRHASMPLLGLGTTANCSSTGLPAIGYEDDRPLSADVLARLAVWEDAERRLRGVLERQLKLADLASPYDFDHLGRQAGDISYIAVVHADGNGMGQRIQQLGSDFATSNQNRDYITALRTFSRDVEAASQQALNTLTDLLLNHWGFTEDTQEEAIIGKTRDVCQDEWVTVNAVVMAHDKKTQKPYLPFRPLVFGGDDLTFVTDGRLGLSLAAAYLDAFAVAAEAQKNPYLANVQACAGVAVVKAHYPFARAYELAADLCLNAKQAWEREHAALDWHFAATGLFGDIRAIRERQYTVRDGHLEMRPVLLHAQPGYWRTWDGFCNIARELLIGEAWVGKRNKVIALREALRDGPDAVARFRHIYELSELPLLNAGIAALQTTGWDGAGRCGYFDVVDALDFFLPLEWGKERD